MVKRQSETGQIRKEEFEQTENQNNPSMGRFDMASQDQMSKRKIIRVSNRKKRPSVSADNTTRPFSAPVSTSQGTSNPFANTKLEAPSANISMFAPNNAPAFENSFNSGINSTAVNKPTTTKTSKDIKPLSITGDGGGNAQLNKAEILNLKMIRLSQSMWNKNPKADWIHWLKKYVDKMEVLQKESNIEEGSDEEEQCVTTGMNSTNEDKDAVAPKATAAIESPFSSASVPKINAFASATTTSSQPTSNLTFGISPNAPAAAPPPPAPFAGFSFGGQPAASVAPPKSITPAVQSSFGDAMPKETATEVIPASNEDEEELLLCRAKYRKYMKEDKTWKDFSAGKLRLFRHKTTQNCGLVLRNEYGSVQLNLAIGKGMAFEKRAGKKSGNVQFAAVQDSAAGLELFAIAVKLESLDALHNSLEEMAK